MHPNERVPQPFPWRIFLHTYAVQLCVLFAALLASGLLARSYFKDEILAQSEKSMESALNIAARLLTPAEAENWCELAGRDSQYRVTLLDLNGNVICDSQHDSGDMENHADRPEISDALGSGRGVAVRHSATVGADLLYLAKAKEGEQFILRFALPLSDLNQALGELDRALVVALLVMAVLLSLGEFWIARVFVEPIRSLLVRAEVALSSQESGLTIAQLGRSTWGEWENLDSVIESLRRELKTKMRTLEEEKMETGIIMDSISDAILVVDDSNHVIFVNKRFGSLFPNVDAKLRPELASFCREPVLLELLKHVMSTAAHKQVRTLSLELPQGTRYFALSASSLRRSETEASGAVVVFHDVTDLKVAEKVRIDFVANVSHEMRTPLASIKGFADTALSDVQSGLMPTVDILEPIVRNSERMVKIVADLLELSTLDSAVITAVEPVDCGEMTERIASGFRQLFGERDQTLEIDGAGLVVNANPLRLEQVLINLIDNASKYSPKGSRVKVQWRKTKEGLVLSVADNGPGIEESHLPRLFERFYRIDKGRSRSLGGTGLGLAIVKHIMLAHGGNVKVESRVQAGTTFHCLFPDRVAGEAGMAT